MTLEFLATLERFFSMVTLNDLHNVSLTLTLREEACKNIEHMKSLCRLFLKALEDYNVYLSYLIFNLNLLFSSC